MEIARRDAGESTKRNGTLDEVMAVDTTVLYSDKLGRILLEFLGEKYRVSLRRILDSVGDCGQVKSLCNVV